MGLPADVLKCVAFIGYKPARAREPVPIGTVLLADRPIEGSEDRFEYAITALHCIRAIRKHYDTTYLRINLKLGKAKWFPLPIERWIEHPRDHTVDVALTHFSISNEMDHGACPLESGVNDHCRKSMYNIGVGDAVFMPGLLSKRYGKTRNVPIVRHGLIAALADEKIPVTIDGKNALADAYLLEIRSIKGLSGSPVFMDLGWGRHGGSTSGGPTWGPCCFLGIMRGHFHDKVEDAVLEDTTEDELGSMNIGIAGCTPWEKIMEVVEQPKVRAKEDSMLAKRAQEAPALSEDSKPPHPPA